MQVESLDINKSSVILMNVELKHRHKRKVKLLYFSNTSLVNMEYIADVIVNNIGKMRESMHHELTLLNLQ